MTAQLYVSTFVCQLACAIGHKEEAQGKLKRSAGPNDVRPYSELVTNVSNLSPKFYINNTKSVCSESASIAMFTSVYWAIRVMQITCMYFETCITPCFSVEFRLQTLITSICL